MDIHFSDDDVRYFHIMDAFLQRYTKESEGTRRFPDILDDTERREAIARNASHAAKFLEACTRAELETKLMIWTIAASVAEAIVNAHRILQ